MSEQVSEEFQGEFVKSEDEFGAEDVDIPTSGAGLPKVSSNHTFFSDSRSSISSTVLSRTDSPDDHAFGGQEIKEEKEKQKPENIKKDIEARGILGHKMGLSQEPQLRSSLISAVVSQDEATSSGSLANTNMSADTEQSESMPTILAFKRESDMIDSRPSSASSTSTVEILLKKEAEQKLKREVSFHEPELVKLGERETSFISRPGNLPVELSTTCTQTEWSWLKDKEFFEEIMSKKPDWVNEQNTSRRDSKSSAGSSKSSSTKRRRKKTVGKRCPPTSPLTGGRTFSEELMAKEEKEKQDSKEGTGSTDVSRKPPSPLFRKPRYSVVSPLPTMPRDNDMLFRPPTVEQSSSSNSEDEDDYLVNDESLIPSIGPPTILQYIKESQHPPLSNEEVKDREKMAQSEFLKKSMFSGPCMFCKEEVLPFPTVEELENIPPEQLFCCPQYERFVKFELSQRGDKSHIRDELIDIKPHPPYGTKAARRAAKERAAERAREREMERQKAAGMNPTNFYALTRQMKTITYSLASTKCMEEGWTVKPPSPSHSDDGLGDDPFVIEINPLQLRRRGFLERFYQDGKRFLLLLPDGTGCCYYPSGNIAVMITSTEQGKFTYMAFEDSDDYEKNHSGMLAVFDPSGHGACYFPNGAVRLVVDPFGGVLLDSQGSRKKKWLWHNTKNHVHAPPFQPITFSITKQLSIRCLAQTKVVVTFNHGKYTAKFNVGSKLKAVRIPKPPVERDDHEMHLAEVKQFINILLDRTQNALRLPNYPRLDKIPLPLRLQKSKDAMRKGQLRPIRPGSQSDSATVTVN